MMFVNRKGSISMSEASRIADLADIIIQQYEEVGRAISFPAAVGLADDIIDGITEGALDDPED